MRRAIALAAVLTAVVGLQAADAQAPLAPELAPEQFQAHDTTVPGMIDGAGTITFLSRTCNPDGSGRVRYVVEGPAGGNYTGTYRETGVATWGAPPSPGFFSQVTRFRAAFVISSTVPPARIVGSKRLTGGSGARCQNRPPGALQFVDVSTSVTWEATIVTPTARCTDRGPGVVISLLQIERFVGLPEAGTEEEFIEDFNSDGVPPSCRARDDDDDDD